MAQRHRHTCRGELKQDVPRKLEVPALDSLCPVGPYLTVGFLSAVEIEPVCNAG